MEEEFKFNFIIFSTPSDYYDAVYYDLRKFFNVQYVRDILTTNNKFLNFCFRIHFYFQGNLLPNNPLKSIFNPYLYNEIFNNNLPKCFIFTERTLFLLNFEYLDYLRGKYPDAKFVCYVQDIVDSIKNIDFKAIINEFDLVISYDKEEATKYNILYYPTPYSYYPFNEDKNLKTSDVFFVGRAKNRLNDIIRIFERLREIGLTCDFHITDVDEAHQVYPEQIHYNRRLTYKETLQHVINTKCILEVLQKGATGSSLRTWEALFYDKLLLTNNHLIKQLPCYDERFMNVYQDLSQLEREFFIQDSNKIHYPQKKNLHPKLLLHFIQKNLGR